MNENLISKKELLEQTGISYGQLYRWKRKNLIPDDWFVRKSTFTGQETFFPKEKILARIDQIKNMKDDISLDDLAGIFSPGFSGIVMKKEDLLETKLISEKSLDCFVMKFGERKEFDFVMILYIYILERCFVSGEVDENDGKLILTILETIYPKFSGKNCILLMIKKDGVPICCLSEKVELYFDIDVRTICRIDINECIENLKLKLF
jgi:hypothetical protein